MKNQKSRTQREIVGSRINEPSMNCEESIGVILDLIRKEATLKVEACQALLHCFCTSWGRDTKGFTRWTANRPNKSARISTINNTPKMTKI